MTTTVHDDRDLMRYEISQDPDHPIEPMDPEVLDLEYELLWMKQDPEINPFLYDQGETFDE